ncbi:glutamyl-tRNA synthetase [Daejeonella rubra]|uniref:Glutamate--tRNA ligase n=1 Tax=Daejeonella rubra TaxID=990371 RepID=A0A1G9Q6S6_9SPHI|nr:glutamate--tRNA ligase [Daejeonella rubra]SDM06639.1 glutamyl-tRNA synthetase [Daejeonella rubra]
MPDITKKVRVRFAPSPTGGLHLGGVRTVLFNYLFARKHGGDFILRIEDTDQNRYVEGAEQYILDCLAWCGLNPDEGPKNGGPFAPYRQSERKANYRIYAEQLVRDGYAYYAFDTTEELDEQRQKTPNFRYGHENRSFMRNSLNLSAEETKELLDQGVPHVIRIKVPADETLHFVDMIRGDVSFDTNLVDDKVLLKADGMPTYHLAVVVDDYLMKISHAFRGEEWLPSAPVHILLWEYLGWKADMPEWVHLPLILKPDGNGKLSKRDGDRLGFPVYAMNWTDPKTGETTRGFREMGYLPEAFVNMLALLGWNDGTEQEIFSMDELIEKFSIERVSKAGAKFDFEKAKWFNHEYIKRSEVADIRDLVFNILKEKGIQISDNEYFEKVLSAVKERMIFLQDFWEQASFFFEQPATYDLNAVKPKWTEAKTEFFNELIKTYEAISGSEEWETVNLETVFKALAEEKGIKPGELMLPFRVMLVGGKFGPGVFDIAVLIGKDETIRRIQKALIAFTEE